MAEDLNHFKSAQKALVCMGNSAEDFFYGTVCRVQYMTLVSLVNGGTYR